MNIGAVYPQTEYGSDPTAIRDFAQTVETLGYTHIVAYDHVLGANPDRPGGWSGPYTYESTFMEIFVLFTYMAAVTHKIGFVTGILILPQRQTALVAKQAASLDVLSGGRLRLGVGLGWNTVEYQSLGQDFHTRGRRIEEQVTLLRQLWTQPLVQFNGRFDTIPDAGIKPLPVQRPIPIWMGGSDERVLRRAARLADGWMPNFRTAADAQPALQKLSQYLAEIGRSREKFGLEARLPYGQGDLPSLRAAVEAWQQAGATHLAINTLGSGYRTPGEHLAALEKFAPLAHS